MDDILTTINKSVKDLSQSIDQHTIFTADDVEYSKDGISLLALKNQALLSYLESLVVIIAARIQQALSGDEKDSAEIKKIFDSAVQSSVIQRVTLEKGVKGLEAKISYQIDKLIRAYLKTKEQAEKPTQVVETPEGDVSDSDEDDLNYKPQPTHLLGERKGAVVKSSKRVESDQDYDECSKKYRIPKISAVTMVEDRHTKEKSTRRQKNALMEEYIKESSDMPRTEYSIGSTILDHGRGGERTEKQRSKEQEVQRYEEENYTRLQGLSQKQERRAARIRQRDAYGKSFFGEDWSFLGRPYRNDSDRPKRKKSASAWEKAKRRRGE